MKNKILIALAYTLFSLQVLTAGSAAGDGRPFVIGSHVGSSNKGAGFFFCFMGVLNNLAWCERNNRTPIVFWDHRSLYYEKNGYHGAHNVWEYYFEPVSEASYDPSAPVRNTYDAPDGSGIKQLKANSLCSYYSEGQQRKIAHALVKKYVKIKPYIQEKIASFYRTKMAGKKTIGMHLRGTDKRAEIKPVSIETMCSSANALAKNYSGCQFLVATDEKKILQKAARLLQGQVIYYDAYRSSNGKPVHGKGQRFNSMNKARLGEEVLIETLLLSKCDMFLHSCSNVSSAVLFFNPELPHILFENGQ